MFCIARSVCVCVCNNGFCLVKFIYPTYKLVELTTFSGKENGQSRKSRNYSRKRLLGAQNGVLWKSLFHKMAALRQFRRRSFKIEKRVSVTFHLNISFIFCVNLYNGEKTIFFSSNIFYPFFSVYSACVFAWSFIVFGFKRVSVYDCYMSASFKCTNCLV